ncbi:MAG TPA: hypothetical protein VGJ36_11310 [Gemmatimonadales bacterium]|jgi:hypothetical protein
MTTQWQKQLRFLVIGTLAAPAASCGDDTTNLTQGSIQIETTTGGVDLDPDGYTVAVDEESPVDIGISDQLIVNNLGLGTHQLTLAELATNCVTAEGKNPQSISVVGGDTVLVAFEVTCAPLNGGGGLLRRSIP